MDSSNSHDKNIYSISEYSISKKINPSKYSTTRSLSHPNRAICLKVFELSRIPSTYS